MADVTLLLERAEALLAPLAERMERPEANRLDAYLPATALVDAVKAIRGADWGYLSAITGLDIPPVEGGEGYIEALYHFCESAAVVTLRARVPYSAPTLPTVCGELPAATLYERELIELFGVEVEGTPVTDRLVLPDDWPVGVYPLRKSFKGL